MALVLVVSHSRTGGTDRLLDAFLAGLGDPMFSSIDVRHVDALAATAEDVTGVAAVVVATPENFGAMSGAVKYFFETVFHPLGDSSRGLPFQLLVKAGTDGSGAVRTVEPIVAGLGWRPFRPPLVVVGDIEVEHLETATELGMTLAATLEGDG